MHYGGIPKENNFATIFDLILNDINKNEINCIYIQKDNKNEIQLLYNYSKEDFKYLDESYKQIEDKDEKLQYLETKELNKKIFEDSMEIYINEKKLNLNINIMREKIKKLKLSLNLKIF